MSKIAVAGTGYVGLSLATLLAQHNDVTAVDIVPERVDMVNNRKSPIQDDYIEDYLANKPLSLKATLDWQAGYAGAEYVVIAAPTNYDSARNFFDTSAVEDVIRKVMEVNPEATMVIKSTIPVGYTEHIRRETGSRNIIFAPEFLRESKALYDNLYPSRIIVGYDHGDASLEAACPPLRRAHQGRRHQAGRARPLHGHDRGRGRQALRQHLPRPARQLLQRARHLRRDEGPRHPGHHRGRMPRPPHRHPLQQPLLRLRRLLPAQGHQAAAGQLCRRAAEPDPRHRGEQPHPQGLHRRPGAEEGRLLRLLQPRRLRCLGRARMPPSASTASP